MMVVVFFLHRLAEGILPCRLDQINADPKGNWYWLVQRKIDWQIKVQLDQAETKSVKVGRQVTHSLQLIHQEYYQGNSKGFGDYKVGGKVICTLKYAGDLVLLAKEETVLEDMIDKITGIGRCYWMEVNVE